MRTLMRIDHANCPSCTESTRGVLLTNPMVHDVHMNTTTGCWVIEHDDDPSTIAEVLQESLHGWKVQSNGEIEMVSTTAEPLDQCWSVHLG